MYRNIQKTFERVATNGAETRNKERANQRDGVRTLMRRQPEQETERPDISSSGSSQWRRGERRRRIGPIEEGEVRRGKTVG